MPAARVIPCLLLRDGSLVKSVGFRKHAYIGDPINTARIFNELEVDELTILDIDATRQGRGPRVDLLRQICDECFMPLSYGGGITSVEEIRTVLGAGYEKIVINSAAWRNPALITEAARIFGSQAIIASVDCRRTLLGRYECFIAGGEEKIGLQAEAWVARLQELGAGEILLTSIDREGSWKGLDIELIRKITARVRLPVIAHGGAGTVDHIGAAVHEGHASAVALGSMVVFQKQGMGVLVNFPSPSKLHELGLSL